MTQQQQYWHGIVPLSLPESDHFPERIISICSIDSDFIVLSADHNIYYCVIREGILNFKKISTVLAIDIAYANETLFIVDIHGRLYKTNIQDLENKEEIVVKEEAKYCPHGFRTASFKVKFRNVVASEYGQLFISIDGQLWGCGTMPQISLDTTEISKISFFEGRTVYSAALGCDFAAVIARKNFKPSGNNETDSENEDEEVFASNCTQCQAVIGLASPASVPSISDACPLGMQLSKSSDESSSTTAPQTDVQADAHSFTEDSSQTSEDTKIAKPVKGLDPDLVQGETVKTTCDNICNNKKEPQTIRESEGDNFNNIFMNTDAARQFLSRQLSWVTAGEDYLVEYTEKPTRIIKENVSNLTNLVYEGVKTVGDKVATLSRHVSGSSETNEILEHTTQNLTNEANSLLYNFNSKFDDFSTSTVASDKEGEYVANSKVYNMIKLGKSILSTELWTWGDITHGQLGIGDTIKRLKPMLVTNLSGLGLQKISCGKWHIAALTLDGRLFVWGHNHYHQVSFDSKDDKSGPVQFTENLNNDRVRDMIATDNHTLVYTHNDNIYFMGKHLDGYTESLVNLNESDEINNLEQEIDKDKYKLIALVKRNQCHHWRILSSGKLSYSFIDELPRTPMLPDLSIAQKCLEEMLLIYHQLIKPFLKKSKAITLHSKVYEECTDHFANLLYLTAFNVLSMWQYIENHIAACDISIIKNCEEYINIYRKYLTCLCDLISISGFTRISNILVEVPSSIHSLFSDQLPSNKQRNNKKSAEAIIALAFAQPLSRLSSYKCILQSLIRYNAKKNSDTKESFQTKLNEVLQSLVSIIEQQERKKRDAEITKLFWETTGKVIDQHRLPSRRLIRESKSRPLNMVHTGRFTNHWFILFNDVFMHISGSTQSIYPLEILWIEAVADTDALHNVIQLITPEETLLVMTTTANEKSEWIQAFHMCIKQVLKKGANIKPPSIRTAGYTFTNKNQFFKDAKYHGRWLDGKVHGHGKAEWPDGKVYAGQFQLNYICGQGKMDIPGVGMYEGQWKDNLQNGYGIMKYVSGDVYEGYFKDGLAHGHGIKKQGDLTSSLASIYMGEWANGAKQGYGVMDDIGKGEKYLGNWSDNKKNGCGLIVTLDGIYYEGVFMHDVLTGHGVMVFEDGTHYEGEFRSAGVFSGKGTLTFCSGDRIEGHLSGAWTDGVKISNATLQLNVSNPELPDNAKPISFGKLCVAPDQKWNALFRQCYQCLGIPETILTPNGSHIANLTSKTDNKKIWQNVAVTISSSHKGGGKKKLLSVYKKKSDYELEESVECLELIPQFGQDSLTLESYRELKEYLLKACECAHHPLGQLVIGVTNAFNSTYGGVCVHPLLLSHAVAELKSVASRLYRLVRLLFPALPPDGTDVLLPHGAAASATRAESGAVDSGEVVSGGALLQGLLLPRAHPALFVLYALHNKREDDLYWRRLLKWNRQPDLALMALLGVSQKFWLGYASKEGQLSPQFPSKELVFQEAVETLQQLKTTFSPVEKLLVIRNTFQKMTDAVQRELGAGYLWSMDELFPVFHFVVVRARILQLGSEIHFVDDFLPAPALHHGELGIMFTTLKACYFQILQEKMAIT